MKSHVLITGGTHGVGRATVALLLGRGMQVSACARSAKDIENLSLEANSDLLLAVQGDIRSEADLQRFVELAYNRFGRITGLVNNAGEACVGQLHTAPVAELLSYFEFKVARALRLIQLVIPRMPPEGGSIVNVAGAAGVDPTALLGIAGVANAAMRNLSRMLADELAEKRIRVNSVNPGTLDTRLGEEVVQRFAQELGVAPELVRDEMYGSLPLGRVPTAQDVAATIAFFLSPEAAMLTGAELTPDGGTLIRRLRG